MPENPTAIVAACWLIVSILKWAREERKEARSEISPEKIAVSRDRHHRTTDDIEAGVERMETAQSDRDHADEMWRKDQLAVLKEIRGGIQELVTKG